MCHLEGEWIREKKAMWGLKGYFTDRAQKTTTMLLEKIARKKKSMPNGPKDGKKTSMMERQKTQKLFASRSTGSVPKGFRKIEKRCRRTQKPK